VFVGTFEHSLDDKGRIVLPSTFRSHLADRGYLTKLDGCLGLWTPDEFAAVTARLVEKVREGLAPQGARRAFSSDAHEVRPDSQGRITIPQRLREFAHLERDAVVVGALERIEIWDAARWQEVSAAADESLTDAVTALGL
jgi:MraZ protein